MPPTSICIGWPTLWMAFGSTSTQAGGPGSDGAAARRKEAVPKIRSARGMRSPWKASSETAAVHGLRRQRLAEAALADRLDVLGGLETGAPGAAAPPQEQHDPFARVLGDVEGTARACGERLAERRIAAGQVGPYRHRRIAQPPGAVGVGRRHQPEKKQPEGEVEGHEASARP